MLAALNHPNICAIYGIEMAEGIRFLVLELVEGETLTETLANVSRMPGWRRRPGAVPGLDNYGQLAVVLHISHTNEASFTATSNPQTSRLPATAW